MGSWRPRRGPFRLCARGVEQRPRFLRYGTGDAARDRLLAFVVGAPDFVGDDAQAFFDYGSGRSIVDADALALMWPLRIVQTWIEVVSRNDQYAARLETLV